MGKTISKNILSSIDQQIAEIRHLKKKAERSQIGGFLSHRWIKNGATILFSAISVYILINLIHTSQEAILSIQWQLNLVALISSISLYLLVIVIAVSIWGMMLYLLGVKVPWTHHFYAYTVAPLANRLPIPLGYVGGRLVAYDKSISRKTITYASMIEWFLLLISALILSIYPWTMSFSIIVQIIIFGLLLLIGALVTPFILHRIQIVISMGDISGKSFLKRWNLGLLLYLPVWILGGIMYFFMIQTFFPITYSEIPQVLFIWATLGFFTMLISLLPRSFGVRAALQALLLSTVLSESQSVLISVLTGIILLGFEVVLAVVSIFIWGRGTNSYGNGTIGNEL